MSERRHLSWAEHYERILSSEHRQTKEVRNYLKEAEMASPPKFEDVTIEWKDEFAPGSSQIRTTDPSKMKGLAKSAFYGDEWHLIGEAAIARASDFGLPSLWWPTLGFCSVVGSDKLAATIQIWRYATEGTPEASEDWICLQIYYHVLVLSSYYTEQAPQQMVFEGIF